MNCRQLYVWIIILFFTNNVFSQNKQNRKDQSFKVGGINLIIPSPNDELVEVGYDNREKMEIFVPTNNRLISAFLSESDNRNLTDGGQLDMNTYALVEIPRNGEYMDCSQSDFQEVITAAKESFGEIIGESLKESEEEINRRMKSLDLGSIQIGEAKQLGSLFSKKDAFSFCMLTTVENDEGKRNLVMGGILLRVKKRLLFVYMYTEYINSESISWIGKTTDKWSDAIFNANK